MKKVEELSQYGKGLEMPRETLKKQQQLMFKLLKKEFGLFGMIGLGIRVMKHAKRLKKEHPDQVKIAASVGKDQDKQVIMTAALFFAIADKSGRKSGQEFMTKLIQTMAPITLPAIHQLDEVVKCGGDTFTNNKKFTRAMFEECDRLGSWKNDGFIDTEDCLEFKVTKCVNVELMEALGCPELKKMGCDHDLAAYPLMEDASQCEFRRPITIADGDDYCHFFYYRKGTAPDTAHLNK
jgi:hypothetical protein